ncbi:MAG: UbiX family flavin prenyltransferase [Candidatus Dasytiphilus stammeri]
MKRIIIGISGATGIIYGVRILQILQKIHGVETHLVMSLSARQTLNLETNYSLQDLKVLADSVHDVRNIASSLSSGSFKTDGMVIVPCSMKTLSGIAHSYTDSLLTRAADVILKERRRLVLCIRETPLHLGHLRLMSMVAENGAVIMPLIPAFYHNPKRIEDILDQSIIRVLDQFSITTTNDLFYRWTGISLNLKQ